MFQKKVKGNVHLPNFFFVFESCDVEYCYRFCVGFLWKWNDDNTERFYCFKFPIECGIIFATLEWWKATITNEWIHIVHISIHKQQCVYCVVFLYLHIFNEIRHCDGNFCAGLQDENRFCWLLFSMFLPSMDWTKAENWNNLIKHA